MNKLSNPHIDIQYSRFLAPFFNFHTKHVLKKDDPSWEPPELEEVQSRIEEQQKSWSLVESKIVEGLQEFVGLTFIENRIPVYIVPARKGAFSDPIVISSRLEGDRFVDLLTHELIHRLVTYNKEGISVGKIFDDLFPETKERLVLNHIFVHAVHKHIYLNVIKDKQRLLDDIERMQDAPAYKQAWDIVEESGYEEIMEQIQSKF